MLVDRNASNCDFAEAESRLQEVQHENKQAAATGKAVCQRHKPKLTLKVKEHFSQISVSICFAFISLLCVVKLLRIYHDPVN